MSETNKDEQKPKTSRLALYSFLIPILYLFGSCCIIYPMFLDMQNPSETLWYLGALICLVTISYPFVLPISFILGFIAIIKIALSKRLLKGYTLSILGILMSVWAFDAGGKTLNAGRIYSMAKVCQSRMKQLGSMMKDYSQLHNGQYPASDRWCDIIYTFWKSKNQGMVERIVADMERDGDAERIDFAISNNAGFFCPGYSGRHGKQSSYAINPNCRPDSPLDTVLLFETEAGWNKFGGPESVSFNHKIPSILPFRWEKGCNVLFDDGHAELIDSEKIGKLKWKDEKAR